MKGKLIFISLLVNTLLIYSQVNSVSFFAEYSNPLSERLAVTEIDGVGGGLQVKFDLGQNLKLNLTASYSLFSLNQDSAISRWDWRFWSRYSDFVNQTLSSPVYQADLGPVQKMDLIPVYVTLEYEFYPSEKIRISPFGGGGIYFYNRRLYINEDWKKSYEDLGYTFEYSFRNFAPDKSGNPVFYTGGLEIAYYFTETFSLFSRFKYLGILSTEGKFGYDDFPFENGLDIGAGINLRY